LKFDTSSQVEERFSILLLGTQMATGGAQKILLDQADWFHARGYPVSTAFLYDRDGLHLAWRDAHPFPIHNLEAFESNAGIFRRSFLIFRGLLRLWKLLRQNRFDVIETFTLDSNLFALPLAWLAGVPVRIATNHGWAQTDSPLKRMLHTLLLNSRIADVLIVVTGMGRRQSIREGARPELVVSIPNGIQLPPVMEKSGGLFPGILKIPSGQAVLLSAGRLVPEKAYEVLIEAIRILLQEYPDVAVAIAGSGVLQDQLQSLIGQLHLSEKIHLLGNRQDVPDLMANADIFVMSSRSEGMPVALLEAMSFGLPVVATRVGGVAEVVEDRAQGILVPPEDPAELAKAILELLRNPGLRSSMGKSARRRIEEKYTIEIMCRHYEKTMTDLCREKKQG